jgi:F-type H+-transporting ATPase subunit b
MHVLIAQFGTCLFGRLALADSAGSDPGLGAQLGGLFLGAVPTIVLFIVLVVAYQLLVQGPLTATLKERYARSQGAVEEAAKAIARAEARAQEYAERLRLARVEVSKMRDGRIQKWNAERDRTLEEARKAAQARVAQAKAEVEAEALQARQTIEASVSDLAGRVVRAVLPQAAGGIR